MKNFLAIVLLSALFIAVGLLCAKLWFEFVMGLPAPLWFKFALLR